MGLLCDSKQESSCVHIACLLPVFILNDASHINLLDLPSLCLIDASFDPLQKSFMAVPSNTACFLGYQSKENICLAEWEIQN